MAGRLASVPEESTDGSMAALRSPHGLYRDSIRRIAVSGGAQRRPALFSSSGSSYSWLSSDSGASNSCPSSNSSCSTGSARSAAAAADFGYQQLKTIVRRMISDGYTQRMAQAFTNASPALASEHGGVHSNRVLESWFFELDVDWVLQIRVKHGSEWQWVFNNSALSLQDLLERWIRGLGVIVHSIGELVFPDGHNNEMEGVTRFGEASIAEMLGFVDAIIPFLQEDAISLGSLLHWLPHPFLKTEKLQAGLDMYVCVCKSYMIVPVSMHTESSIIFNEIRSSLARQGDRLKNAIFSTVKEVRTLMEDDEWWAIDILRGRGKVHRNTRLMVNSILYMEEAVTMMDHNAPSHKNGRALEGLRNDTIVYLKDLLSRKSELCSDPSLRYLFLLNNSHFVDQQCEPSRFSIGYKRDKITLECEEYMHSYFHASWGHVLSCIRNSRFPAPINRWINTSSLAKFELAVRKTCQAQKYWKVRDPLLRNELRKTISTRVVYVYRHYLEEHPELQKHVGHGISSPQVLEEMLGELFEG